MTSITKRDGRVVPFNRQKIEMAILKAFQEVDGKVTPYAKEKARNIADYIRKEAEDRVFSVEEIQDMVEKGLMSSRRKDVARSYITYRNERTKVRNCNNELRLKIKEKLFAKNVQNQNANLDEHSFGGRMGEANSEQLRDIALNDGFMSDMARNNHLNNMIYIHDLDHYVIGSHNCLTIPFDKLLKNGFNTRQTDVRPANSISTAFQLLAVIFQLQSLCQFGGVSAGHLDWTMVPYVRKSFAKHFKDGIKYILKNEEYAKIVPSELAFDDNEANAPHNKEVYQYAMDMVTRETMQAAEGMFHNLDTLQSRSGNQLPFSSINYGTCTLPEGRLVIRALLEGSLSGVGKFHKTSIFPCGIFQCMKGVNLDKGDPNYDLFRLALKSTAKRLYPNYANCDWSGNAGYDKNDPSTYFSTMGLVELSSYKIF